MDDQKSDKNQIEIGEISPSIKSSHLSSEISNKKRLRSDTSSDASKRRSDSRGSIRRR